MKYLGIIILIIAQAVFCALEVIWDRDKRSCSFWLLVVLTNILITIDLGNNYTIALSGYSDGIAIHGLLSKIVIYEDVWTIQLFENYYKFLMIYTIVMIFAYFIFNLKNKKHNVKNCKKIN